MCPRPKQQPKSVYLTAVFVVALLAMLVVRASSSVVDPDLWHQLALARQTSQMGHVPHQDHFSYFPTLFPSVHHEWGAGVIAQTITQWFGDSGIVGVKWLLTFGIAFTCFFSNRRKQVSLPVFGLLAIPIIFLADYGFSTIRAQLYSFLCAAFLLYCFELDRNGRRIWLGPWLILYTIWLNLHAGFLLGGALFFLHWVECLLRREKHLHLLATGVVMALLIAVNPYGYHYYEYLWSATTIPRPQISEWASLWESGRPHQIVAFAIAAFLFLYAMRARSLRTLRGFPLVLVTGVYAVQHARMLPFFAIAWLSLVPGYLQPTVIGKSIDQAWQNMGAVWSVIWSLAVVALLVAIVGARPWQLRVPGAYRPELGHSHTYYPVGAVDYLDSNRFQGNLMVPFDHGAYVLWKLHPMVKVSIDSRYEAAYPPGALEDNLSLYMARDEWQKTLSSHSTHAVLVPRWTPLEQILEPASRNQQPVAGVQIRLVYRDDAFSLYVLGTQFSKLAFVDREGEQIMGVFP